MNNLLNAFREGRWFNEVLSIKSNPRNYLVKKSLTEDEFLLDVLQVLFEDGVIEQCKVELLNILQEFTSLFDTFDATENAIGSLQNLFSQVISDKKLSANGFLSSQILNTIVVILLNHADSVEKLPTYFNFLREVIDLLWNYCSKVNSISKYLIRYSSIQGLIEIETNFPGILSSKLEEIKKFCEVEKTFMLQLYSALLSVVLKTSCSEEKLKQLHFNTNIATLYSTNQEFDLQSAKRYLNFMSDIFPFMSPTLVIYSLQNLLEVLMQFKEISPLVFKPIYIRFLQTGNPVAFSSVLYLQKEFGPIIASDAETKQLVLQLLRQINHPSVPVANRLLSSVWCLENFQLLKQFSNDMIFEYCQCSGFDGADTQFMNQRLLSLSLSPSSAPDEISDKLISSLNIFRKRLLYGYQMKIIVAIFRSLYWFYINHSKTIIKPEIQKIVLSMFADKPKLANHLLDFVQVVRVFDPDSILPTELIISIVNNVTKLKVSSIYLDDLKNYLVVLGYAVRECLLLNQSAMVIIFLMRLLEGTQIDENEGWILGNKILAICRDLLYYQEIDNFYIAFGDLLQKIANKFVNDMDIRDQALLYYNMLTSISLKKLSVMMQGSIYDADRDPLFEMLLPDKKSSSGKSLSIINSHMPIVRFRKTIKNSTNLCHSSNSSSCCQIPDDIMKTYFNHIESPNFQPYVTVNYCISLIEEQLTSDGIVLLNFSFISPKFYGSVKDIRTTLSKEINCRHGQFTFTPTKCEPADLKVRVNFNELNSHTCSIKLPNLSIEFEDFFLPLNLPASIHDTEDTRLELFNKLESHFMHQAKSKLDSGYCLLPISMKINKNDFDEFVLPLFQPFLVSSEDVDIKNFMIFIPPKHHLLVKIEMLENDVDIVKFLFLTDHMRLLRHFHDMLNRIIPTEN